MTTLLPRVRPLSAGTVGVMLALALGAGLAEAQQQAPAPRVQPAPPARPATGQVVAPPVQLPPPTKPAAAAPRATAGSQVPTAAPVRPAPASALPPDSVRPAAAAAAVTTPANAVALCRDGTFILPPNDASACATHRGVVVHLPRAVGTPPPPPPVAPASRALAPVAATRAPPAGATMRCKDGTYLTGAPADGRCDTYGGLATVLPAARPAPPPPPQPRRP